MPAPDLGAEPLPAPPASHLKLVRDLALGLGGLVLLIAFALGGHSRLPAMAALGLGIVAALWSTPSLRTLIYPLIGATALLGPLGPGIFVYDPIAIVLAVIALLRTAALGDRAGWDLRTPGILGLLFLGAPLLVLLGGVPSLVSFLGAYKQLLSLALIFFALRRLVPREQSNVLLWIFPLFGVIGSLQLAAKTAGLGALLFARLGYRNFYTRVAWGQSDFVSAVMEFCMCMCVVLWILDRRPLARAILVASVALMSQSFLILFSRAGAVGLALFTGVLAIGVGGRKTLAAIAAAAVIAMAALTTPGGQVFVHRFTEPSEYQSWYARLVFMQNGWDRFVSHPLVGIGLNQGRYQNDPQGRESTTNLFLDVMSEQGILGGLVLLAIVVAAFWLCFRVQPYGFRDNPRLLRLALAAAVGEMILHSMVEPVISGPQVSVPFAFLLAWLCLNDSRRSPA